MITVPAGVTLRLDVFLARHIQDYSRTRIQALIKNRQITVNGSAVMPRYCLNAGDVITIKFPDEESRPDKPKPVNISLNILFENEDLVVIDKQPGLVVHPGAGNRNNTLVNGLVYHFRNLSDYNGPDRPGIVHRLDKDTSGIMVIAKNNRSHVFLARQFEKRAVKKTYFGITWGVWEDDQGMIEGNISRKPSDPTTYVISTKGRESLTEWKVIETGRYLSAVEFYPQTGRTHQIRVHTSSVNHPIFADDKYGGGKNRTKGYLPEISRELVKMLNSIRRHALHARSITIRIPDVEEPQTFTTEIPGDILAIMNELHRL